MSTEMQAPGERQAMRPVDETAELLSNGTPVFTLDGGPAALGSEDETSEPTFGSGQVYSQILARRAARLAQLPPRRRVAKPIDVSENRFKRPRV